MSVFIIPKKERNLIFITYYFHLKQQLVHNTKQQHIMGDNIQKLKVFQFEKALYLNTKVQEYINHIYSMTKAQFRTLISIFGVQFIE